MNLKQFENNIKGDNSVVLTTKKTAQALAFEIDDSSIFEDLKHGEYFNYKTAKVFTDAKDYKLYGEYLRNLKKQ